MDLKMLVSSTILMGMVAFSTQSFALEPSAPTTDFVRKASMGNMFEIETSKLAVNRTSSKNVKDFAGMMVADHTQIGDQFKKALADSGTNLSPATTFDGDHQKTFDELKSAPAAAFDNLYVQAQSKAHDDAVTVFSAYAENGDSDSLKKFAADALPIIKKHQEMVHNLTQAYMTTHQ